jgi:hypothetical protein
MGIEFALPEIETMEFPPENRFVANFSDLEEPVSPPSTLFDAAIDSLFAPREIVISVDSLPPTLPIPLCSELMPSTIGFLPRKTERPLEYIQDFAAFDDSHPYCALAFVADLSCVTIENSLPHIFEEERRRKNNDWASENLLELSDPSYILLTGMLRRCFCL